MKIDAKARIALHQFWVRNEKKIVAIVVFWIIILIINQVIKNMKTEVTMINTYTPDEAIITDNKVPQNYAGQIRDLVADYISYGNSKDYDRAFSLLTDDYKSFAFGNDIDEFKKYIDSKFDTEKSYDLQNFSNVGDVYVYTLTVYDDIAATGTTGTYKTEPQSIAFIKSKKNNQFKMTLEGYIQRKEINKEKDSEYLNVKVISKDVMYSRQWFNIKLKNKSDKYVILRDNSEMNEIYVTVSTEQRPTVSYLPYMLEPGEETEITVPFNVYFDEETEPSLLSFNSVRVFEEYSILSTKETAEENYSLNIELTK